MKFDKAEKVQQVVWRMREVERGHSSDRSVLQSHFNGEPPFNERTAEENGVQINRNFLKGVQVLADARRQWNQAFLSTPNYFACKFDSGPVHKRDTWGKKLTKSINKYLKGSRGMLEQVRSTGANTLLHGIGPCTWKDRDNPVPVPLPIDAVLIPSQSEIDFDNLSHFAVYREYTPAQLVELTSGTKNPGWNMPLVKALLKKKLSEDTKNLGSYAEWSPERIEEVIKQDGGFYDSDAVPTIDCLDFYFREAEDGDGWYRRVVLDWDTASSAQSIEMPKRDWGKDDKETDPDKNFLYTSGHRPYAKSLSEILHCQFGDCSAYAPFKYHSVRSLGWLIWGVSDLMNRMECKFYESVFQNLMWLFRVTGENDFNRLKKAAFWHLGVVPNGIGIIPATDRFAPNPALLEQARASLRANIAETSASYTHDFDKGQNTRELTATETMARVNSINSLLAGMMTLAYSYEEYKYQEIVRRILVGNHPAAKKIRQQALKDGIPQKMLDPERVEVQAERVIGAGNKTVEMAAINFLQTIRKNLGPDAQRKVDHISIRSVTDQPDLADDLAPLDNENMVSNSTHDAELASERLLRGLPFSMRPEMVFEDYVIVWLKDLAMTVQKAIAFKSADPELLAGIQNMAQHIGQFIQIMSSNDEDKPKIKQYADALGQIMNHVKALAQQVQEQQAKPEDGNGAETAASIQAKMIESQAKAANTRESHAQRTAQRQVQFEMEEQRKDRALEGEIAREGARTAAEIQAERIKAANAPKEPESI